MSFLRPVFWQQGLFLEPQHFQLLEFQQRQALSFLVGALRPYPWGLAELEIDEDALVNSTIRLVKLDLWLPDGQRLSLGQNADIPPRSFAKSWDDADERLFVYLAVPIFSHSGSNVNLSVTTADSALSRLKRFNSALEPELIPDLYADGPESRVDTLTFNSYLLFGREVEKTLEAVFFIPLALLQKEGEKVAISRHYAPPSLTLYPSNPLLRIGNEVIELLKAKARQLEQYKTSFSQANQENHGGALMLLTVMGAVSRFLARLHNLLFPQSVHPHALFSVLRELAAELTVFAPGLSPLGENLTDGGSSLKNYDHLDPYPAFQETKFLIARLLDAVSPGPEMTLTFKREGRSFTLFLPSTFSPNYVCWLSIRSSLDSEALQRSLSTFAKLASPARSENLISFNLPGIALRFLPSPPLGLPRSPETFYFSPNQNDPMWDEAIKNRSLCLFWDQAPEGTIVSLSANHW
ncbi:MAG: type VI secretion system baseplate subunit TssK [Deltaproteobacteria bacterium]|jgi:type VI secretion system protein ImpJ|nr:type VI secretion system baseplate subunit TssK [Deltaproteobacteria bacterium]